MCTTAAWVNHSGGFSFLSAVSVKGFLSLSRLVSLFALCLKLAQAFSYALPFRRLYQFLHGAKSVISISKTGFGGIACSRIRFCMKSFALLTILRNRLGSQPLLLIDWLVFSCISVHLTSRYSEITNLLKSFLRRSISNNTMLLNAT